MKIEIVIVNNREAKLVIDGRELSVVREQAGVTALKGIKQPETSSTLGGLIASHLFPEIDSIIRAQYIAGDAGTWGLLDEQIAYDIDDALFM